MVHVTRAQLFIERFVVPGEVPVLTESSATEKLVIRLDRRELTYQMGNTILDAARRAG